ncbi:hypothetical protein GQ53DRAFT_638388 [Thozetella sp. PMI_491]|nr:hypothetical protein GQ53DRAFT_638388 [Thozetella sp. PMI_491]
MSAQSTCRTHEQCGRMCQDRYRRNMYTMLPSVKKADKIDLRDDLAASTAALSLGSSPVNIARHKEPIIIAPDTPRFAYKALSAPDRTIRLFKIKPAIFRADPVDCEMAEFNVSEAPAFGALSYCWSTIPPNRPMLCNGAVFTATPSLERALKRLRAGFRPGHREAYIWADALCINQADDNEMSDQIQLMDKIYSTADTVYADLGDLSSLIYTQGGSRVTVEEDLTGMGQQDEFSIWQQDPDADILYYTLLIALQMPWFRRTWIIQEFVLAKRVKYLFHGTIFTQQQLDGMISDEALRGNEQRKSEMHAVTGLGYMNYLKIQEIKRVVGLGQRDGLNLISLTRDFLVTQPKDKIWALAALLSKEDRAALGPYSQSAHDVHRRFVSLHIRSGRILESIGFAGLQRRAPDNGSSRISRVQPPLPTWVPDWTAQTALPKDIAFLRPEPYSAYGPLRQPSVRLIGDSLGSGGLGIRGVRVDTLTLVLPGGTPVERAEEDFPYWHGCTRAVFDAWVQKGFSPYLDNDEIFARLLLMDDMYTGRNATDDTSPILDAKATYRQAMATWPPNEDILAGYRPSRKNAVETFRMQATTACYGRVFALTDTNSVGLVPAIAKAGDMVVVFCGGIVPHILRKTEGGYHLVGDAFIHGFMYGSALHAEAPLDDLLEEFVLV